VKVETRHGDQHPGLEGFISHHLLARNRL
jgi:hypothetical protein